MIGIIPAAGRATRFSNNIKELLPISNTKTLLDCSIKFCIDQGCSTIVLVTNNDKLPIHNYYINKLDNKSVNIVYKIQSEKSKDLLGALISGLEYGYSKDGFLFVMPDTLVSVADSYISKESPITFGVFKTKTPDRYGVILNDRIYDKDKSLIDGTTEYTAWGIIYLSDEVASYIYLNNFDNQVAALSSAMGRFGYGTFDLDYYKDFSNFSDYKDWIKNESSSTN